MSERWNTEQEEQTQAILTGLTESYESLNADTIDHKWCSVAFGYFAILLSAGAVASEVYTEHWGREPQGLTAVGLACVAGAVLEYRRKNNSEAQAFDVERQIIEIELEEN